MLDYRLEVSLHPEGPATLGSVVCCCSEKLVADEEDGLGTQMVEAIKNIYVILTITAVSSNVLHRYIRTYVPYQIK
jgi:hypothetical protein